MTIFYVPNPTQYLNLTITLLIINKQQINSLLKQNTFVNRDNWTLKCDQKM